MSIEGCLNLLALVIVPVAVVLIGQHLQVRAKKRDDKMRIFESLMVSRIFGLSAETVRAYNMIHLVFSNDREVREKWSDYYKALCVGGKSEGYLAELEAKQLALLEAMASSLGYKDDVSQESLSTRYTPVGMMEALEKSQRQQDCYGGVLGEISRRLEIGQDLPRL